MSSSVFSEVERLRVRVASLEKQVEQLVRKQQQETWSSSTQDCYKAENDWDSSWESSSMEC